MFDRKTAAWARWRVMAAARTARISNGRRRRQTNSGMSGRHGKPISMALSGRRRRQNLTGRLISRSVVSALLLHTAHARCCASLRLLLAPCARRCCAAPAAHMLRYAANVLPLSNTSRHARRVSDGRRIKCNSKRRARGGAAICGGNGGVIGLARRAIVASSWRASIFRLSGSWRSAKA